MRIALYHNLTSGGSKREAYEFTRQMVLHGHTVDVYSPTTSDEEYLSLPTIASRYFTFDLKLLPNFEGRLPLLRRYIDLARYAANLKRLDHVARIIARQIDKGNYDWTLVHHDQIVQGPYVLRHLQTNSAYYCGEANRGVYEPSIFRPGYRSSSRLDRLQSCWYAPVDRLQLGLLQKEDRANLLCAKVHLTNSFFTAETLYRIYGVRARVCYLGVDDKRFYPMGLARQNFVLSVGAVSPLKGYDFLIEALALLPSNERPRLLIVGNTASNSEAHYLFSVAHSRGVQLEIKVRVSENELVYLYNQARAFVYAPILEPFGLVVLEAMACATPVVAVKEGGVRESLIDGSTGMLSPRDIGHFAKVLHCVLADSNLARKLGQSSREEVERFWTWRHAYGRLMEHLSGDHQKFPPIDLQFT